MEIRGGDSQRRRWHRLSAAIDYLEQVGVQAVRDHEIELTEYAIERLSEEPDIHLYGPRDARRKGGVAAFNLGDVHAHDVGTMLDVEGICIRAGHHGEPGPG